MGCNRFGGAGRTVITGFLLALTLVVRIAQGDVLLDETHVVAAGAAPVEHALTVTQAGRLDVTVVDAAFPAPLSALRVAVTRGATVVNSLAAPGVLSFDATPGEYVIRVIGRPDAVQLAGVATVAVTPSGAVQPVLQTFAAAFQLPPTNALQLQLDQPLTLPEAGDYTFTLADHAFPAALPSLTAAVFLGSQLVSVMAPGQPVTLRNLAASSPGSAAQYKITVLATADSTAKAGLFGLTVVGGPSQTVVFDASTPVGALDPAQNVVVTAPGTVTLRLVDFQFPAPLNRLGGALTSGGAVVAKASVPGTASGTAMAGSLQLWRTAQAGAAPGSYLIAVDAGGANLYTDTQSASSSAASGPLAFSFPFSVAAAGNYTARVTDFLFPSGLQSLQFAVAQGGQILQRASTGGELGFTAAAGEASLLVIAQPPTGGSGLFGAEILTTGAAPSNLLDQTRAVGSLFQTREVVAVTSGRYDVALTDGAWPARFQSLALALTRGGQVVGKIFGGGTFFFDAIPGRYLATFVATPATTENAGLYSLRVQSSVPTVSLSSDLTSIESGQGVRLSWTSTGATACTASGGWSGSKDPAGSGVAVGPLTANTTFTLTCTGPGGTSAPASVSVSVVAKPASGVGGGGGAVGTLELLALAALLMARLGSRRGAAVVFARRRSASDHERRSALAYVSQNKQKQ